MVKFEYATSFAIRKVLRKLWEKDYGFGQHIKITSENNISIFSVTGTQKVAKLIISLRKPYSFKTI